jgi:putative glycosyltransferase (TIGR04372 family)
MFLDTPILLRTVKTAQRLVRADWHWLRPIVLALFTSVLCRRAVVVLCSAADESARPYLVKGVTKLCRSSDRIQAYLRTADRYRLRKGTLASVETYLFFLIEAQEFDRASEVLRTAISDKDRLAANIARIDMTLAYELARYPEVVTAVDRNSRGSMQLARNRYDFLRGSFAAAKSLRRNAALEFFGRHFGLIDDELSVAGPDEIERVKSIIVERTVAQLHVKILAAQLQNPKARIGVFFTSSTEALGHAILDVYHFIALARSRFDHLIFVGAERRAYRPASRVCLDIIEQYGSYTETHDPLLLDISWMSLGTISAGPVEIIVENYWSLLREVVHRTRDPADLFKLNQWHMSLPAFMEQTGEEFCIESNIDLEQPIVVLHARDDGYHGIVKQSHRNADIMDYQSAVEYLIAAGFQVVRVGDRGMRKLPITLDGYFELPFMEGYSPRLDPFFIARSTFMIGCQSGPCAYARVFGRPLLSVNAVYHYTLLPAAREMGCFKRYYVMEAGKRVAIGPDEILDRRLFHCDTAHQFKQAGVEIESATSEEILAAVKDMLAWIEQPDLPETSEQQSFHVLTEKAAVAIKDAQDLNLPIADYLGYVLPGYRMSPTVTRMRGELLAVSGDPAEPEPSLESSSANSVR